MFNSTFSFKYTNKISRQASHKETKALIELRVIKSQGVGKATYYALD